MRMRPLTDTIPKPMVEVQGFPLLHHIMRHYSSYGCQEFIICLGYKGGVIKDYFLNYRNRHADMEIDLKKNTVRYMAPESDWNIVLAETGEKTMTGGRLLAIRKYLSPGEPFFFTYGDALSDVDIAGVLRSHRACGKILTMTAVHPKNHAGVITLDEWDSVRSFCEKPVEWGRWINGGYFVADDTIFRYIRGDEPLEQEPMHRLVADGQVQAYRHEGWWQCADTEKDVEALRVFCGEMREREAFYDREFEEAAL